MGFENSILAGTKLVRESIQSPNYVAGVSGWTINKDGSAEFNNITVRGNLQSADYVANTSGYKLTYATGSAELNELTARGTVQSSNFSTGVSGWKIDNTGSAEFQDVTARGTFQTDTTGERIVITESGSGARVDLYSGDVDEVAPGFIQSAILSGNPRLTVRGPNIGSGAINALWTVPSADSAGNTGSFTISSTSGFTNPFVVSLGNSISDAAVNIISSVDASLSTGVPPLMIGDQSGLNLIFDVNEIMARNNSSTSTLNIQNDGGTTQIGGPIQCADMRAVDNYDSATISTSSTTYVNAGTACSFTFPYPPSGTVHVTVSGRIFNNTTNTGHAACLSFEIRDTNSSGTIREAADDSIAAINRALSGGVPMAASRTAVITGLPTSGTGFIRAMLRTSNGTNAANALQVNISLIPSP